MRATIGGALLALSAIALSGCTAEGVQPVTGPSTPSASVVSIASPTSTGTAASVINRRGDDLIEVIQRYKDQGCAYGRTGTTCSQDQARIHRISDIMRAELEAVKPWAPAVEALAKRTQSRLAAVSRMTDGSAKGGSMLDTELTSLVVDLDSWSTVSD